MSFKKNIQKETDFKNELNNIKRFNHNFKNDNNPILRRACYCKASPGFKVALFTNRNQNSKENSNYRHVFCN